MVFIYNNNNDDDKGGDTSEFKAFFGSSDKRDK
jgi:hypothetical protein